MSGFEVQRAVFTPSPATIVLSGVSGTGKTYTALLMARVLGKRVGMVSTERKKARRYAGMFDFDIIDIDPPYASIRYRDAIRQLARDYDVVIGDSMSHEHEGEGGMLNYQAEEFKRLNYNAKRKGESWQKPKADHQALLVEIMQCDAHLILCFRAKKKTKIVKNPETGKTEWLDAGIQFIGSADIPFEGELHLAMEKDDRNHGGMYTVERITKGLEERIPDKGQVTEDTARAILEWSMGAIPKPSGKRHRRWLPRKTSSRSWPRKRISMMRWTPR